MPKPPDDSPEDDRDLKQAFAPIRGRPIGLSDDLPERVQHAIQRADRPRGAYRGVAGLFVELVVQSLNIFAWRGRSKKNKEGRE